MSKRFLITGAQGFVGRYLAAHLLSVDGGAEILGIGRSPRDDEQFTHAIHWGTTRLAAPLPDELKTALCDKRYYYRAVDLKNCVRVRRALREFRPRVVIHLASALRDDPPESLFRVNVEGTMRLIEAIAESHIDPPTLIMGSSGGVYGIPSRDELPLKEVAPCRPIDPYSISKLAAEQAARTLARLYDIPVIRARLFNLVGPGQDERHACGRFASALAAIASHPLPRIIEVGRLTTTRDFIDVRDAAHALLVLVERGVAGATYNIGSGSETSIDTVLATTLSVARLTGSVKIRTTGERALDIPRHFADVERLKALGFQPRYDLEQSIRDLFRYYVETVAGQARQTALRYAAG
jgi:nucleoside-diphosphate-sugar epimerase